MSKKDVCNASDRRRKAVLTRQRIFREAWSLASAPELEPRALRASRDGVERFALSVRGRSHTTRGESVHR